MERGPVIRCHLPDLMQQHQLRISDVARATGLNRSTISALCRQRATRIELPALDRLCALFHCGVGELLEHVAEPTGRSA
jgi:putative transcriptional regulator